MRSTIALAAAASLLTSQTVGAVDLDVSSQQSIKDAAKAIANTTWSYYTGDTDSSRLGLLNDGVYWWEAGAFFGSMISYSYLTGDTQYDSDVAKAIYSQVSPTKDLMMTATQLNNLGNDDQAFWALTAMSAAEHKLPVPDGAPSDIWLTAASGAFNDLVGRWNTTFCNGGIKWQFVVANNGFDYKSTIANAATMQLGARLALLTGNQTYADKATQFYDWMSAVGYVSDSYQVLDGAGDDPGNCTQIDQHEWSYNSAALLGGAAAMANYTAKAGNSAMSSTWTTRTQGLWQHASEKFFKDNVLYEQACEDVGTCNTDQKSFKAYMSRWATFAGQVVPSVMSDVQSKLQTTCTAVAKSCTGNGFNVCGMKWYNNVFDGETGVGQQMSALEAVVGLLGPDVPFVAGMGSKSSSSSSSSATSAPASAASSVSMTGVPASTGSAAATFSGAQTGAAKVATQASLGAASAATGSVATGSAAYGAQTGTQASNSSSPAVASGASDDSDCSETITSTITVTSTSASSAAASSPATTANAIPTSSPAAYPSAVPSVVANSPSTQAYTAPPSAYTGVTGVFGTGNGTVAGTGLAASGTGAVKPKTTSSIVQASGAGSLGVGINLPCLVALASCMLMWGW